MSKLFHEILTFVDCQAEYDDMCEGMACGCMANIHVIMITSRKVIYTYGTHIFSMQKRRPI